jgi:predicted GIY-YIG superfamily endonuclease
MINGIIYKIYSESKNKCYIGSTTQNIETRLIKHKSRKRRDANYKTCEEILDEPDVKIVMVEELKNITRTELLRREGEIMKETGNVINKVISGRTRAEYYQDKTAIKTFCECGGRYSEIYKNRHFKTNRHKNYFVE